MRRGRTTLVIAHRYSMVRDADCVLVLDAGRIVEAGTPAALLSAGGWFARLAVGARDQPEPGQHADGDARHSRRESDDPDA